MNRMIQRMEFEDKQREEERAERAAGKAAEEASAKAALDPFAAEHDPQPNPAALIQNSEQQGLYTLSWVLNCRWDAYSS